MASTLTSSGQVLLTGGSSRGGRGTVTRMLVRGREGWRVVSVEPSGDLSESVSHERHSLRPVRTCHLHVAPSQVCDSTTAPPLFLEEVLWYTAVAPLLSTQPKAFSE